jgi:hypothetical protein
MKDFLSHQTKPWSICNLSRNPNITMKDGNPDWKWIYGWLSRNPNITIEDILANPKKTWDWDDISHNPFLCHPVLRSKAINKLSMFRAKHRHEMQLKHLYTTTLYSDLITSIAIFL